MAQQRFSVILDANDTGLQATLRSTAREAKALGKALDDAAEAADGTADKTKKAGAGAREASGGIAGMVGSLRDLKVQAAAVGGFFAIGWLKNRVVDIKDAGLAIQGIRAQLLAVTGSSSQAAEELAFVARVADDLGINFEKSASGYARLTAAAVGTNLAGEKTRQIFTSVAQASRVLNLSADQTAGAITAIEQMMSKGTVSAEELRGQLGERIPGAFNIAARAMNVTTEELNAMLVRGEVLASDFLPRFAAELMKSTAAGKELAASGPDATFKRMTNAVFNAAAAIAESGVLEQLAGVAKWITKISEGTAEFLNDSKALGSLEHSMRFGADFAANISTWDFRGAVNQLTDLQAQMVAVANTTKNDTTPALDVLKMSVSGLSGAVETAQSYWDQWNDKQAAPQLKALNKSIKEQVQALEEQNTAFGKSRTELAEYQRSQALAAASTDDQRVYIEALFGPLIEQAKLFDKNAASQRAEREARTASTKAAREAASSQRDYAQSLRVVEDAQQDALEMLDNLRAAHDPLLQAQQEFGAQLIEIQMAMAIGAISFEEGAEAIALLEAALDDATRAIENQLSPMDQLLADLAFEADLIGLSSTEREVAIALRQAEMTLQQQGIGLDSAEAASKLQVVEAMVRSNQAKQASVEAVQQWQSITTSAIGSVADALGEFVVNGLKDWKSFGDQMVSIAKRWVAQVIAEMARMAMMRMFTGQGGGMNWGQMAAGLFGGGGGGGGGGGMNFTSMLTGGGGFGGGGGGGMNLLNSSTYTGLLYGSGQTTALGSMMGVANYGPGMATTWTPTGMGAAAGYAAGAAGAYYGLTQRGSSTGSAGSIAAGVSYGALGLGAVGAIGGIAGGAGAVAGATGAFASLGASAAIPVIGWIVAIAAIVDLISGGRLFGTRFRPESAESALRIAEEGAEATTTVRDVRQRSLFQGREWRTREVDPGDEARDAAQQLFDIVRDTMTAAATELGADVPPMINAAIRTVQQYDKKGRIKATQIFVDVLGRSWEEATAELAATRINAEAIIATIDHVMLGAADAITMGLDQVGTAVEVGTGGSAGGEGGTGGGGGGGGGRMPGIDQLAKDAQTMVQSASQVAERWRHDAELLMAGAQFLLVAARDIVAGNALLGEAATLGATTDLIEDLQRGEETLIQTYQRVSQAAGLFDQALEISGVEMGLAREELVRLAVDIADSAGGLDQASQLWNNFFANFYDQTELQLGQIADSVAAANELLEPLGMDTNTTREEYRRRFAEALPTLDADEIVQWLRAGAALDAIADSADGLMAQVDAIIASAGPPPTFEQHMAAITAEFDLMESQARALGLTEAELARIEQARAVAVDQLREAQARALAEYDDYFAGLEVETFGSDFAQEMREINVWTTEAINTANELARAAGMAAAREEDLARIHVIAAERAARAIAQLREATMDIAAELYGTPLDNIEAQIAEIEASMGGAFSSAVDSVGAIGTAFDNLRERQIQGLESIQDWLDASLLGDLSGLTEEQQLSEAQRQLMEAISAANAGDPEAMARIPQLADAYLRLYRDAEASGDDYNSEFFRIRDLISGIAGAVDLAPEVPGAPGSTGGSGAVVGYTTAELDALYRERDELLAQQEAQHRLELATRLAEHLQELARAQGAPVLALAASMGISLEQLATDMGADLSNITGQSVTALGQLASALGISLGELTGGLGLNLTDLAGGLTELTEGLGINLSALTTESAAALGTLLSGLGLSLEDFAAAVGMDLGESLGQLAADMGIDLANLGTAQVAQLAALASSLGISLSSMTTQLGIDLGDLADSQSLLNDAVEDAIEDLPAAQRDELRPLLRAVETATTAADANAAINALHGGVNELPEDLRAQLAPLLDDLPPASAYNELDHLTTIAAAAGDQLSVLQDSKNLLRRIADNAREANAAAGVPSYAVGTSFVPQTGPAILHAGEAVLPVPLAKLYRTGQLGAGGGDVDAQLRQIRAALEAIERAIGRGSHQVAESVERSGERTGERIERAARISVESGRQRSDRWPSSVF